MRFTPVGFLPNGSGAMPAKPDKQKEEDGFVKKKTKLIIIFVITAVILLAAAWQIYRVSRPSRGFRLVSSYAKVQKAFNVNAKPGVYYPDLEPLNFDASTMEYMLWPANLLNDEPERKGEIDNYVISGDAAIGGERLGCVFTCSKRLLNTVYISEPVMYKDYELYHPNGEINPEVYKEGFYVAVNGYEYGLSFSCREWSTRTEQEKEDLITQIRDTGFAFIHNIIDEADENA